MGSCPATTGDRSDVQRVGRHLHKGVGEPALERATVTRTGASSKRQNGGLERGRSNGIEQASHCQGAVRARNELKAIVLSLVQMLIQDGGGIVGVASMDAVVPEASDGVLASELKKRELVKWRWRDRRR